MGDTPKPYPKTGTQKRLVATEAHITRLESFVPKGWKFLRAAFTITENHGEGLRVWFAKKPPRPSERRPNLRLLTTEQAKTLTPQLLNGYAAGSGKSADDVIIDIVIGELQLRELFNLGADVQLLGVGTIHADESAKKVRHGKGFFLRLTK